MAFPVILLGLGAIGLLAAAGASSAKAAPGAPRLPGAPGARPGAAQVFPAGVSDPRAWGPAYTNLTDQQKVQLLTERGMPLSSDPELSARLAATGKKGIVVQTPAARAVAVKEPVKKVMPKELQALFAEALKLLTVDDNGVVRGPVGKTAVRTATQLAGRLDNEGFPKAAASLRTLAQKAATMIPPPKEADKIPLPPQMSPALQDRVQKMIQSERDPAKLQKLVDALGQYKNTSEGKMAISMLKALIVQIETANETRRALEAAQAVMSAPTKVPPAPVVTLAPPEPVVAPEAPVVPQPEPPAKTPLQQSAEALASHLRSVQKRYGMPEAKGQEDSTIVGRFQKLAGGGVDYKAGPGTLIRVASTGASMLPLVMYWPRGSNLATVQQYRNKIRDLANQAEGQGHRDVANELRMSANMETGQGGVARYGATLS